MQNVLQTITLGAVEGLTEFLPVSSTAHLILTTELMGLEHSDFQKSFDIVIQVGAILAVVILYWKRLLRDWRVFSRVALAFLPTAVLGLVFYRLVKDYLLGSLPVVLWALFLGGAFLVAFEHWRVWRAKRRSAEGEPPAPEYGIGLSRMSYRQCLVIGLCQSLAMVPGVSRSGATIVGGLLMGLPRKTIVEFSFLLAVPTMVAAAGLDLLKSAGDFRAEQLGLMVLGFAVSFMTAWLAVKWLLAYIAKNDFRWFGWYRIGLVAVIGLLLFA